MSPIYQTSFGPDGNCYQACVASLLDKTLEEVPDLSGPSWPTLLRRWLGTQGKVLCFLPGGGRLLEESTCPAGLSILSQRVRDGSIHAVVCNDGEIVHDPSPRPFSSPKFSSELWTIIRNKT